MKSRKKKIISVQIIIFLVASLLLYKTYHRENKYVEEAQEVVVENDSNINSFKDCYSPLYSPLVSSITFATASISISFLPPPVKPIIN